MHRVVIAWSIGLAFSMSISAMAAPKKTKPTAKPTALDAIRIDDSDESDSPRYGGSSERWMVRSDDTVVYVRTFAFTDYDTGSPDIPPQKETRGTGRVEAGTYKRLLRYLQWTRLLDMKPLNPEKQGSRLIVTLVQGRKIRRIRMPYYDPQPADVYAATWTTLTLIRAITAKIKWDVGAKPNVRHLHSP